MWIFGYGSLVWKPGFAFRRASDARLRGFVRRFWQGSPDHRGTPEAPGRVATLVEAPGEHVIGRAFEVERDVYDAVLGRLDHREKGGYTRHEVELELLGEPDRRVPALLYVASPRNPHYLGPAAVAEMAAHIARSRGPSGPNDEYLRELDRWLTARGHDDPHVRALAAALDAAPLDAEALDAEALDAEALDGRRTVEPSRGPHENS